MSRHEEQGGDAERVDEDGEDLSIIEQIRQNLPQYPHRNRGVLQSYVDDGFSAPEIAERLHVHPSTIRNWLDEFDLEASTQPREERRSGSWHPHDVGDRVVDRDQPGEERSPAVVVELPGATAEQLIVDEIGAPVSALNENYPPESRVALVAFERDLDENASGWRDVPVDELAERLERCSVKTYAYPLPRLDEAGGDE